MDIGKIKVVKIYCRCCKRITKFNIDNIQSKCSECASLKKKSIKCCCGHYNTQHLYFPDKRMGRPCGKCNCNNFRKSNFPTPTQFKNAFNKIDSGSVNMKPLVKKLREKLKR